METSIEVWTPEEAENFKKIVEDMEEICDTNYLTFFQQVHKKDIAARVRDWIIAICIKLIRFNREYRSSTSLRSVLVSELIRCFQERKTSLKFVSSSHGASNPSMNALSLKMVELQEKVVTYERDLFLKSKFMRVVEAAINEDAFRANRFIEKMAAMPKEFFECGISDGKSQDQVGKINGVAWSKDLLERLVSEQIMWQGPNKPSCEVQRRMDQLAFLPGQNTMNLFNSIWPNLTPPVSKTRGKTHLNSSHDTESTVLNFSCLPLEIRMMIWKAALPDARIVCTKGDLSGKLTPEEPSPRLALQLACKESYMAMKENYTIVFELLLDYALTSAREMDIWEDNWKNCFRLARTYINPDKDIVYRSCHVDEFSGGNLSTHACWSRTLLGLARVKHLALEMCYFFNELLTSYNENPIKIDTFDALEASCPNLETLMITWHDQEIGEEWFGDDSYQGQDIKFLDINSNFLDHANSIPGANRREIVRSRCWLNETRKAMIKFFDDLREGGSEYWKRVKIRFVFFVKPLRDWHDFNDMYNRYEGISLMFEEPRIEEISDVFEELKI